MADHVLSSQLAPEAAPIDQADSAAGSRQAGPLQLVLLLAVSCLSVLGAVLIAPVLPQMSTAFASTPGVGTLVPIVLSTPALFIGLAAPFAGLVVDRIDRKRALVVATAVYAIVGTMPLYLDSLGTIIASRALVGLCEGMVMTAATTLIVDYWDGPRRARYLGLQTLAAALSAIVFTGVGGALGAAGWRVPFWIYLVGLPLAVGIGIAIFRPKAPARDVSQPLASIPWRQLALPLVVTLIGGVVFYTLVVHVSFVLTDNGLPGTGRIGAVIAGMSALTALGSVAFGLMVRRGTRLLLTVGFALAAAGFAVVALAGSPAPIILGSLVAGFGTGLLLPTMLTWTVNQLTFDQRGRGTGLFTGALFLGEFLCPLFVAAIAHVVGGRQGAIGVLAVVALVMAVVTSLVVKSEGAVSDAVPASAEPGRALHP